MRKEYSMEKMQEKVIEILTELFDEKTTKLEDLLLKLQKDSLKFIQFIIEIEDQFGIYVGEDNLLPEKFDSFDKIIEIIKTSERNDV